MRIVFRFNGKPTCGNLPNHVLTLYAERSATLYRDWACAEKAEADVRQSVNRHCRESLAMHLGPGTKA